MAKPWDSLPNLQEAPRRSGCLSHGILVVAGVAFGCCGGFIATPFFVERLWAFGLYNGGWPWNMLTAAAILALCAVVLPFERTGRFVAAALALAAGVLVGNCMGFASMQ